MSNGLAFRQDNFFLDGLRVIEFDTSVVAPYDTLILAELGAEVIKLERPEVGAAAQPLLPKVLHHLVSRSRITYNSHSAASTGTLARNRCSGLPRNRALFSHNP